MSSETKLPLPAFLKVLTSSNMTMQKAMGVAGKVFKTHNTPAALGDLTDAKLKSLGVENKEDRKAALAAFKKAGYTGKQSGLGATGAAARPRAVGGSIAVASTSASGSEPGGASTGSSKLGSGKKAAQITKKRKRDDDLNVPLPSGPENEAAEMGSFEFNEVLDEEILRTKAAVVNRAPVMSVWATIVAERLGFKREEALSIASAYTEMNAISKGVSLGIFDQRKGKGVELAKGESQPYVDLMGRRMYVCSIVSQVLMIPHTDSLLSPLFQTQTGEWRALVKGEPVEPASAFSYVSRAFRQTLPYIAGAMRLLATSFPPTELNEKGFGLYAEFRPDVTGWGQRAEMRCENVLGLRKERSDEDNVGTSDVNTQAQVNRDGRPEASADGTEGRGEPTGDTEHQEPPPKKTRDTTIGEYEAALDASIDIDDFFYNGDL